VAGVKRKRQGVRGGPVCSRNAHDQNVPLDARSEGPTPHPCGIGTPAAEWRRDEELQLCSIVHSITTNLALPMIGILAT